MGVRPPLPAPRKSIHQESGLPSWEAILAGVQFQELASDARHHRRPRTWTRAPGLVAVRTQPEAKAETAFALVFASEDAGRADGFVSLATRSRVRRGLRSAVPPRYCRELHEGEPALPLLASPVEHTPPEVEWIFSGATPVHAESKVTQLTLELLVCPKAKDPDSYKSTTCCVRYF